MSPFSAFADPRSLAPLNVPPHARSLMRTRALTVLLLSAVPVWGAPLLGALAAPALSYLKFPPHTAPAVHAPFTWPAFAVLSLPAIAFVALFIVARLRAQPGPPPRR